MKFKNSFYFAVYAFLIAVPLSSFKFKYKGIPISADFIIGLIVMILGGIYILTNFRKQYENMKSLLDSNIIALTSFVLVFFFLSVVSIFYSQNKTAAISEILRFVEYVVIFYMLLLLADRNFINRGLRYFFISMIVAAVYGLVQFMFNLSEFKISESSSISRVSATFENPNYWGAAVNLVIFIPILRFLKEKKYRVINIIVFLLLLFNLVLSFTRGSWIAFFLGLLVIFFMEYKSGLLSLPLLFIGGISIPFTRERMLSIFEVSNSSSSGRLLLWKTGWLMFKEHFWFGVGNGNYLYKYYEYVTRYPELYQNRTMYSVHNSYLKMFAELGVFGGVIFILIYLQLLKMTFSSYKRLKDKEMKLICFAFIAFWAAYLFQNFFNNLMFIPQLNVLVWIITAMIYKWLLLEKQEEKL